MESIQTTFPWNLTCQAGHYDYNHSAFIDLNLDLGPRSKQCLYTTPCNSCCNELLYSVAPKNLVVISAAMTGTNLFFSLSGLLFALTAAYYMKIKASKPGSLQRALQFQIVVEGLLFFVNPLIDIASQFQYWQTSTYKVLWAFSGYVSWVLYMSYLGSGATVVFFYVSFLMENKEEVNGLRTKVWTIWSVVSLAEFGLYTAKVVLNQVTYGAITFLLNAVMIVAIDSVAWYSLLKVRITIMKATTKSGQDAKAKKAPMASIFKKMQIITGIFTLITIYLLWGTYFYMDPCRPFYYENSTGGVTIVYIIFEIILAAFTFLALPDATKEKAKKDFSTLMSNASKMSKRSKSSKVESMASKVEKQTSKVSKNSKVEKQQSKASKVSPMDMAVQPRVI